MRAAAGARPAAEAWPSAGALARSRARAPRPVRRVSTFVVEASQKPRRPSLTEPPPLDPDALNPVERALTDGKHVLVAFDGDGARLFRTLAPPRASGDADLPALRLEPVVKYDTRYHVDPDGGSPARPERIERRAGALASSGIGGGGGGGGGSPTSGATPGVGGGYPLTQPVLRGVVLKLRELRPKTILVAAHGKGKSDGKKALLEYARKHAPDVAERVVGEAVHLEGERGGRRLSEAQLLRAARRAYRLLLKPRVPLQARKVRGRKGGTRKVSRV